MPEARFNPLEQAHADAARPTVALDGEQIQSDLEKARYSEWVDEAVLGPNGEHAYGRNVPNISGPKDLESHPYASEVAKERLANVHERAKGHGVKGPGGSAEKFAAYLESRPEITGKAEKTRQNSRKKIIEGFDKAREDHRDTTLQEQADKRNNLSLVGIAKEIREARQLGDRTLEDDLLDLLMEKTDKFIEEKGYNGEQTDKLLERLSKFAGEKTDEEELAAEMAAAEAPDDEPENPVSPPPVTPEGRRAWSAKAPETPEPIDTPETPEPTPEPTPTDVTAKPVWVTVGGSDRMAGDVLPLPSWMHSTPSDTEDDMSFRPEDGEDRGHVALESSVERYARLRKVAPTATEEPSPAEPARRIGYEEADSLDNASERELMLKKDRWLMFDTINKLRFASFLKGRENKQTLRRKLDHEADVYEQGFYRKVSADIKKRVLEGDVKAIRAKEGGEAAAELLKDYFAKEIKAGNTLQRRMGSGGVAAAQLFNEHFAEELETIYDLQQQIDSADEAEAELLKEHFAEEIELGNKLQQQSELAAKGGRVGRGRIRKLASWVPTPGLMRHGRGRADTVRILNKLDEKAIRGVNTEIGIAVRAGGSLDDIVRHLTDKGVFREKYVYGIVGDVQRRRISGATGAAALASAGVSGLISTKIGVPIAGDPEYVSAPILTGAGVGLGGAAYAKARGISLARSVREAVAHSAEEARRHRAGE